MKAYDLSLRSVGLKLCCEDIECGPPDFGVKFCSQRVECGSELSFILTEYKRNSLIVDFNVSSTGIRSAANCRNFV